MRLKSNVDKTKRMKWSWKRTLRQRL